METNERKILVASVALMAVFFAGLLYAQRAYGVRIPSCVTDVKPFDKGQVIQRGAKDFEVHLVARMWAFEPAEVVLPPGSRATIYLSSADVTHGAQILGTNVNLMAVPGTVNMAQVSFDRPGEHLVVCHEFCGRGHQAMAGKFVIREISTEEIARQSGAVAAAQLPGQALFDQYECTTCHSLDGSEGLGPTFKGLFGSTSVGADGAEVKVDDAHFVEAVREPEKKVTKGYDPMPPIEVPDADLQAMVEAFRKLSE